MTTDPADPAEPGPPRPRPPSAPASFPTGIPLREKEWKISPGVFGAAALAFLSWTAWQATGSRLSLFVGAATAAAVAVDITWAQVATRRVRLKVLANPPECVVGDPVAVTLSIEGPRQFLTVAVESLGTPYLPVAVPHDGPHAGHAPSRQVMTHVVVAISGSGVAGLMSCLRRRTIRLAHPLAIGPRPVPAAEPMPDLHRTWGEGEARPAPSGDLVRGVRQYLPGDPMRWVHWRATARVGDLVVKEVEDIDAPRLVIALDLGSGGMAGEQAAGRAAWYALEGIGRSYHVVLATVEHVRDGQATRSRPVTAAVTSPSDVIRRLAAAAAPGKPELPFGAEPGSGVLLVTDRGDSWH